MDSIIAKREAVEASVLSTSMLNSKLASEVLYFALILSIREITAKMIATEMTATSFWSAPSDKPTAIDKNM